MNAKTTELDFSSIELESDSTDIDDVYSEWNSAVNMTASELREWSKNPCSREASTDPIAVIRRNLRLLERNKSDWTTNDVEDAKRTISFIERMRGNEGGTEKTGGTHSCPTNKAISLLNWAYNPYDSVPSAPDNDKLDDVEEVSLASDITAYKVSVDELEFGEGDLVEVSEEAISEAGLDDVGLDENTDGKYPYERMGYVLDKHEDEFKWVDSSGEDSQTISVPDDKTAYVVALGATGAGSHVFYEDALTGRSDEEDDIIGDTESFSPDEAEEAAEENSKLNGGFDIVTPVDNEELAELQTPNDVPGITRNKMGLQPWPESWRESDKPARLIALDAWQSMGLSWRGCRREMTGNIRSPEKYCSAFKDAIYGHTYWRN